MITGKIEIRKEMGGRKGKDKRERENSQYLRLLGYWEDRGKTKAI
jgi:hypothetical protein